ncbi:type IV toxin-antitoxin system AbiEi family antitoxin domain-containing protein [Jeotgalibacillus terrae]|uniref:Type IV toxin-antitoxin system AbiEi family antitoxin domain-containing protein n=1 Tax=Jeotgalibacillus terrae TaxID=587735 RepID=A0ABW5ZH28_9BACL|nr:type IV toxin-antitoxin system AbiEi family antitoxin domain-containing protein [Jeotgalibacillus terrae]MBM7580028.1 hypothetical protein [Jeotgalibacillus terrae]
MEYVKDLIESKLKFVSEREEELIGDIEFMRNDLNATEEKLINIQKERTELTIYLKFFSQDIDESESSVIALAEGDTVETYVSKKVIVSTSQLAEALGLSDARIRMLAAEGAVIKVGQGAYDLPASVAAYIEYKSSKKTEGD